MQSTQKVAWADNAIRLAVEMTVAAIGQIDLEGSSDQQMGSDSRTPAARCTSSGSGDERPPLP